MFSLNDKVAFVTGGNGVLGRALVNGLASAGATVVVVGRKQSTIDEVVKEVKSNNGVALGVVADVLNKEALASARDQALAAFGKIDILVNGAGGNMRGATVSNDLSFFQLEPQQLSDVTQLNLLGTILPSQVIGECMKEKGGVIINISSVASFRPLTNVVGYSAAKAAINNYTAWLAIHFADQFGEKIRVNGIAPGFFLTEQNKSLLTHADGTLTERGKTILARTPFKRFGQPDELVSTLIWLCADASRFVTGVVVPVDGGFTAFAGV